MAFEESEQPASAGSDPASQARAFLEAAGVRGITITGDGESWRVGIGWNEHERFVVAFSEKNPNTPNDPLYLAEQALAALIRNEGPCPHASHETPAETPAPETDALWEPEPQQSQAELDVIAALEADFGAEMLAAEDEAEQDSGDDEALEILPEPSPTPELERVDLLDTGAGPGDGVLGETSDQADRGDQGADAPAYPGIALLEDDLGRRRNQVLAAITARKLVLLDIAADQSQRDFLLEEFVRYQGTGALGLEIDANLQANYLAFCELEKRDKAISDAVRKCERAALDADLEGLERIAAGLEEALR